MRSSKMWRYYSSLVERKVKRIRRTKRQLMAVGVGCLVLGLILGTVFGGMRQKKKTEKRTKETIAEVRKEERQKTKEVQRELERVHQEYEEEEKELPWNMVLVNSSHPMEDGYVPELTEVAKGYSVDSRIAEPLNSILKAAEAEGMNIIICSAYRSIEKQTQVFNLSVQERLNTGLNYWEAYEDTKLSVALPGTSEHGLGLALDLISNQYSELDEKQAETKEAKWLEENCYKYGFILRYPPEKTAETGIIYEPWHYRYVGEEDAKKIMESGMTLEEYLEESY